MKNLLQTIGNTPLIKLEKINAVSSVNLYAKLEGQNPGGSVKDRAALYMVENAIKTAKLQKGMTIIEATSGNMGIALAMIGAQKGYSVQIVMSEGMSLERRNMLKALGATLTLTDRSLGTGGAINKAKELIATFPDKYWFADQFNNPDNIEAHFHTTAKELIDEVTPLDFVVAGVGTSGTIIGIAKRCRQDSPNTKIVGVFPPPGYKIQGIQNPSGDFCGSIYDENLIDEKIEVSKEDAYMMSKKVATSEGLFVGMSSGAALFAAVNLAKRIQKGNIAVIIPDRGEKYLSTELFQ